jgi:hypothetical protein
MILKQAVENRYGNRIEAGEQVSIISHKDNEVYIMPLTSKQSTYPVGMWVKREEVE